ncbi:MAG: tetratricopeptide repeat protein [Lachnospiraceae bacterium]|jgi:TPR repeat protein
MAKKSNTKTITQEEMRQFVRLEKPISQIIGSKKMPDRIVVEEGYNFTLGDVETLLANLAESGMSVDEFENEWAKPLRELFNESTDYAVYTTGSPDRTVLPDSEDKVVEIILEHLDNAWVECDDESRTIASQADIHSLQRLIAMYRGNKDKKPIERDYPDSIKRQFVSRYGRVQEMKKLDDTGKELLARFTQELADKDDIDALQVLAQGSYGGNDVFPCDWNKAAAALTRLTQLQPGNNRAANMLGYIYYYGRISDGKPDYSKAFYYFTIAAAGGDMEAEYKLADCFHKGNGVTANDETAFRLNDMAYETTFEQFTKGDTDCPFADAARRKGNCYLRGIGVTADVMEAYRHYLMADLAIRLRVENGAHYGDDTVQAKIVNALSEAKDILIKSGRFSEKDFAKKRLKCSYPLGLHEALKDGYACEIKVGRKDSGKVLNLTLHRVRKHNDRTPAKILLAIPQFGACFLTDELEWRLKNFEKCDITGGKDKFRFNAWEFDASHGRVWFFYDDRMTASITGGVYIVRNPDVEEGGLFG